MTATTSNRRSLFIASCASLLVTSLSFGIRAGILNDLCRIRTQRSNSAALQLLLSGASR